MIDSTLDNIRTEFAGLWPLLLLFGALAVATKRHAIIAAMRRARNETVTNIVLLAVNALIFVPLVAQPILTGQSRLLREPTLVDFWAVMPGAISVLLAILLIEFAAYWRHRLEHTSALWPIHATHHADETMTWLSVRRKHPLAEILSALVDSLPVIMLGLPFWAIGVALLIRGWWGYFIHADVPWTLGWFGKIFISPAAHRLHHIRDERLMGYNYGNMLSLWDQIFGTYIDPAPYVDCETGIAEGTRNAWGELARPFEARYWRKSVPEVTGDQPV